MSWFFLLVGCALHSEQVGLVQVDRGHAWMLLDEQRKLRLVSATDGPILAQLDGFTVRTSGPRLGRRQVAREWTVIDGGFGSAPYIGRLERYGVHWRVKDRQSGSTFLLEAGSLGELPQHEGRLVLLNGLVVGPHQLRVMGFRVLDASPVPAY